jgi:hypothetical protein
MEKIFFLRSAKRAVSLTPFLQSLLQLDVRKKIVFNFFLSKFT